MSGKKKLTARKKLLDSEEEKAEGEEGEGGEGEQREMETDTVAVAGPSGLTRSQVSSFKGTVSRDEYFFDGHNILISTGGYFLCMR